SPEWLERDGLVSPSLWAGHSFPDDQADFDRVAPFKRAVLRAAWEAFRGGKANHLRESFEAFCHHEAGWLDDFALFM
ncbi:4-alpha-glucanotransferase, partial [Escherichia coli]|nr:4-alpha-glucanotransferase [Escherichia coli]